MNKQNIMKIYFKTGVEHPIDGTNTKIEKTSLSLTKIKHYFFDKPLFFSIVFRTTLYMPANGPKKCREVSDAITIVLDAKLASTLKVSPSCVVKYIYK
jgi:hypothetical protein